MADRNKKVSEENDPIKRMLERLRQSVTDLPPEEPEENENEASADTAGDVVSALSAVLQDASARDGDGIAADTEEIAGPEEDTLEEAEEADEADGDIDGEDERVAEDPVDEGDGEEISAMISEFFAEVEYEEEPAEDTVAGATVADEPAGETAVEDTPDEEDPVAEAEEPFDAGQAEDPEDLPTEEPSSQIPSEELYIKEDILPVTDAVMTPLSDEDEDFLAPAPLEDQLGDVSVDDFASALSWKQGPANADAPDLVEEPDLSYLQRAAEKPKTPAVKNPAGNSLSAMAEENARRTEAEEKNRIAEQEARAADATAEFFAMLGRGEAKKRLTDEDELPFAMHTEISEQEVERLFRNDERDDLARERNRTYRHEVRNNLDVDPDTSMVPDDDNGFAVEVEVRPTFTPAPAEDAVSEMPDFATHAPAQGDEIVAEAVPAVAPEEPEESVETVDAFADDDDFNGAFLDILNKATADAAQPQTPSATHARAGSVDTRRSAADYVADGPGRGEQIQIDFASVDRTPETVSGYDVPAYAPTPVPVEVPASAVREELAHPAAFFEKQDRAADDTVREEASPASAAAAPADLDDDEAGSIVWPAAPKEEAAPAPAPVTEQPRVSPRFFRKQERREEPKPPKKTVPPSQMAQDVYVERQGKDEYTSRNQIGVFSKRYAGLMTRTALRIFALAFLATFLLVTENAVLIGHSALSFFGDATVAVAVNLLVLMLCAVVSWRPIVRAVRSLCDGRVTVELYLVITFLLFIVYNNVLYILRTPEPVLFSFVPAAFALVSAISDYRSIRGEYTSFRLLASAGDKLAASVSGERSSRYEDEALSDLGDGNARLVRVRKIDFPTGFTTRVTRPCDSPRRNLVLLLVALGVSVVVSAIVGVLANDPVAVVATLALSFSCALPAALLLLHAAPVAALGARAAALRCAVVGEVSAHEYSDVQAFAFEDVEAFPSRNVRVKRIKLYGDSALDRVLYQMASAFSVVGGPLDGVFRSSTAELGISADVAFVRAGDAGFVVAVDGHEITVGGGRYMLESRIDMYYDADDEKQLAGGKVNIMYAAEDGQLIAKFYVVYKMDVDFERDVERLARNGIRAVIRTYDPSIRSDLIGKISYVERFGLRVVRKTAEQLNDFAVRRQNSGIVSRSSTRDILRTVLLCRRTSRLIRILEVAGAVAAGIGMAAAATLALTGLLSSALPSIAFVLYQAALALSVGLASKFYVTGK